MVLRLCGTAHRHVHVYFEFPLYEYLYEGNSLTFDCLDGRVAFNFTRSGHIEYVAKFTRNVVPTSGM